MLERAGVGSSLRSGAGCWEALVVALPAAAGGVCSGSSPTGSSKCQAGKADDTCGFQITIYAWTSWIPVLVLVVQFCGFFSPLG